MRRVLVGLVLLAAGCPAHDDGGGGSPDLSAGAADDMAVSSGAHDFATPTAPNGGTIEVQTTPMSWSGAASFYTGTVPTMTPNCSYTTAGACTAAHCTIAGADGGTTGATYSIVSAGTVTVTVGSATPIAFAVQPGGYYVAPGSSTQALFAGGETITFTTSGGVAPASSTTVQAPVPPTLTTPSQPGPYTITRASDFPFAWTGGGPGQFIVSVQTNPSSITPGTPFGSVRCLFAISDGSGVIPSAALAVLPTGSATISFGVSGQTVNVVGDYAITAVAATYPQLAGGQPIGGGQATVN